MLEKEDNENINVTGIQHPETSTATLQIAAIRAACGVIPQVTQVSNLSSFLTRYLVYQRELVKYLVTY